MKIIKHYALPLYIILSLLSCSKAGSPLGNYISDRIKINLDEKHFFSLNNEQFSVDSICPLSLPDGVKIYEITKFMVKNGRAYLMDSNSDKTIHVFDRSGKYLFKAGEQGRAKNEYIDGPTDFFVDDNDNIHVFDGKSKKIIVFGKEGNVIKTVDMREYFPKSIGLLNNENYALSFNYEKLDDNTVLAICNEKNEIEKKLLHTQENYFLFPSNQFFFVNRDRMSHIPLMSDSVLVFHKDILEKVVSFDFGGKFMMKEKPEIATDQHHSLEELRDYEGVHYLCNYQESDNLIYLKYGIRGGFLVSWLYDKQKDKLIAHNYGLFEGLTPFYDIYIEDKQLTAIVTEESLGYNPDDPDFDVVWFKKAYDKSNASVKNIYDGKIKLPAIVYFSVK